MKTLLILLCFYITAAHAQINYCTQIAAQPRINIISDDNISITYVINAAVVNMTVCRVERTWTSDFNVDRTTFDVPTPPGTSYPLTVVDKTHIVPGQQYYYHAQALNSAYSPSTFGQESNTVAENTPQASALSTPVLSLVTATSSGLTVSWPHVTNAVGYWVQRGSGGNFQSFLQSFYVVDTGSGTQSYADNGTGNVSLRVYPVNPGVYSDGPLSNVITHTTP